MNKKTPKNPRGAGREKYIGERFHVICHPNAIKRLRKFAIQESWIEHEKENNNKK